MTEHDIQAAYFDWVRLNHNMDWRYKNIFAIPNNTWAKNKGAARKMIHEGVEAGILDVFVAIPMNNFAGLWIEFKFEDNEMTTKQKDWAYRLHVAGFAVYIVRSVSDAIDLTENYLGGKIHRCQSDLDSLQQTPIGH